MTTTTPSQLIVKQEKKIMSEKMTAPAAAPTLAAPATSKFPSKPAPPTQEMSTVTSKQVKVGFVSGLVSKEKAMAFERILFRATRGNMFLRQEPVDTPFILFLDKRAKAKILKICEVFGANQYHFPEELGKQLRALEEVSTKTKGLKTTIDLIFLHRNSILKDIASLYEQWNYQEFLELQEKFQRLRCNEVIS